MPTVKGNEFVNVIPTKENIDYYRIYLYDNIDIIKNFTSILDGIDLNRVIKQPHVNVIYEEIMNGHFHGEFIAEVRVDINTNVIVDGNHTVSAYKKAWENGSDAIMKVKYMNIPDKKYILPIMKAINNTQKPWGIHDFNEANIKEGDKGSIDLYSFAESHPLCMKKNKVNIRYSSCFLLGYNATKEIKNACLEVTTKDKEFAETIYNEVDSMLNALLYQKNNWLESFIKAWYKIRKTDHVYNEILDKYGFNTFLKYIYELSNGWQLISRSSYWEGAFRTAIWTMKENIEVKHIWNYGKEN